ATPITTPRSVSTLRSLCAHKLDVAIATASERFIDRFAVVVDENRFAVVVDENRFAPAPIAAPSATRSFAAATAGRLVKDPVSGWSMNKVMRECPHPNIRSEAPINYRGTRAAHCINAIHNAKTAGSPSLPAVSSPRLK